MGNNYHTKCSHVEYSDIWIRHTNRRERVLCVLTLDFTEHWGCVRYEKIVFMYAHFLGMSLGLLISALSDSESSAVMLSISLFFPVFMMSGVMWPLQSVRYSFLLFVLPLLRFNSMKVPKWFKIISWSLPSTWAASNNGETGRESSIHCGAVLATHERLTTVD